MSNSRRTAAFIVARWLLTREFPASMLPSGDERAFVQDLVYTVIRRLRPLRFVLGELLPRWPKGELEALVYVGGAQILYMDDVPDFAAVNETVDAAKLSRIPSVSRVVNGVLRNLIRRRAEFTALLAAAPVEVRESFPTELVRRWTARFGAEAAARLCAWHNRSAVTYVARRPPPGGESVFEPLARGVRVPEVPGYAAGEFIVQDPATALAVRALAPQPSERILDACAAPGGKCVQIAWRGAAVTACEVNPARRRRLEENLGRLRLAVRVVGAAEELGAERFDKVLVDAPCSNTGVLRRRVDARWNWSVKKLDELVALQAEILARYAAFVAPGGLLVYSTCSNEREENSLQVERFLADHPDFTLLGSEESLPFETDTDGAFVARLRRR